MGCKGSKQTEVENTYGELNKNIQKTMMLRAGLNLGESSYGIQVGLSKTHKRDFTDLALDGKISPDSGVRGGSIDTS